MHGLARARRLRGVAVPVVLALSVALGAGSGPAAAAVSSYAVVSEACGADDPLDRTAEEQQDGASTWKVTKAYTYGPDQRPVMLTASPINGEASVRLYSTNPRGDVEALTDPAGGAVTATYRYHAYGSPDPEGTLGEDKETAEPGSIAEPVNPYRYNSKRADTALGGIDMGFRNYDPGINQFTSRDSYNGALADLQLGSDPWNTNRYAFTGGNPITRVEMDGHLSADYGNGPSKEDLADDGPDMSYETARHVEGHSEEFPDGDPVQEMASEVLAGYEAVDDRDASRDAAAFAVLTYDFLIGDAIETCSGNLVSGGCGAEAAMATPWGKLAKPLKVLDEALEAGDDVAAGGRKLGKTDDAANNGDDLTRVGRWMSPDEHANMARTREVQVGGGGTTYVSHPPSIEVWRKQTDPGNLFVEFDVPRSALRPGGQPGHAQIPSPSHPLYGRLAEKKGVPLQYPVPACNIVVVGSC